jgi:hypothetical protein
MAKDPAFLFYSADFIVGTYEMTDEQVGRYIRLMCLQHQKGHLSESVVLSVMGGEIDREVIGKLKRDDDGLYYNERLEEETNKRRKYSESRAKNRKGKAVSKSHDNHMSNICNSYDEHMVNKNEDVNEDVNEVKGTKKRMTYDDPGFQAFWSAYPNKKAKSAALKAFTKLKPDTALLAEMLKAIEVQKQSAQWQKDNGQYIPNPATWLNQERWEDEIPTGGKTGKRVSFQAYDQTDQRQDTTYDRVGPDLLAEARALMAGGEQ